jgi:hypothetical protein
MKRFILAFAVLVSFVSVAGVSQEVFIRGKIGNDFDDKRVKVIDSLGQTYYLGKHLFPADFKFKQGEAFAIEIPEKELSDVKVIKK